MLVNQLLAGRCLQEIEAAILAAAALAAYGWDDELHGVDAQRIARKLLYPAYEMRLEDALAALVLGLVTTVSVKTTTSPRPKFSQSILFTITRLPAFSWGGSPP